ncbi:hypothetical protein HS99_0014650 [Kitasatospora aureofaciens]|nr:hypothetical protein HS99_0014650 [Kitasatospora aureofaciens]QEV02731.1 hypothetical protein CP971_29005 [Streptomyces viridifaciens]UKZ09323.1 hypothetical protein BOQ63_035950 [Streptomyces viridifaciens]
MPAESGQPPTAVKVREVPAAIEAREALLAAIAQEARTVVDKQPGQASSALVELAQAYNLLATTSVPVTTDGTSALTPVQSRAGGHQVGMCLELEP